MTLDWTEEYMTLNCRIFCSQLSEYFINSVDGVSKWTFLLLILKYKYQIVTRQTPTIAIISFTLFL